MKQQDKELLLKDLSARLPYRTKVGITYSKDSGSSLRDRICAKEIDILNADIIWLFQQSEIYIKPYLFSLSSMTEEQEDELIKFMAKDWDDMRYHTPDSIDWLNAHHFDYRGLIVKGLAIDATGLNIY